MGKTVPPELLAEWRRRWVETGENARWVRLARRAGTTLPRWAAPLSRQGMTRFLHRSGLSWSWYRELTGHRTVRAAVDDFRRGNADWPLRAWAGIVVEWANNGVH